MVTSENHQLAVGVVHLGNKAVVLLARITGWRAGIENITGNNQRIRLLLHHGLYQPIAPSTVLSLSSTAHKILA